MYKRKLISELDKSIVEEFKKNFKGTILSPGSQEYEKSLIRWSDCSIKRAGLVVKVKNINDISEAIKFANKNNLDVAISGGRHSTSGMSSTEGGLQIDLRLLKEVRVDKEKKLIYAQGGATWKDVDTAAWENGLATVGGAVNTTGIGGLSLGGGFGYLTGKHGLVVDNIEAATIVLADGSIKQVSETSNPDLFWAIRGAGINFAVVYEFVFKAHEQKNKVSAGMLIFPIEKLFNAVNEASKWAEEKQSEDDVLLIEIGRLPPDSKPGFVLFIFCNTDSLETCKSRFAPFFDLSPEMDNVSVIPYDQLNSLHNAMLSDGGRKSFRSSLLKHITAETIQKATDYYIKFTDDHPFANKSALFVELYKPDKFASVDQKATAFSHRFLFYNINIVTECLEQEQDEIMYQFGSEIKSILNEKDAVKDCGYINYGGIKDNLENQIDGLAKARFAYGQNLDRLMELKKLYDPTVLFNKGVTIFPQQ